jgi:hypothetical protein
MYDRRKKQNKRENNILVVGERGKRSRCIEER